MTDRTSAPPVAAPASDLLRTLESCDLAPRLCASCAARAIAALRAESAAAPAQLRERLLRALQANAYRGSWQADRQYMQPMDWDADDAVDRIIEEAALHAPPALDAARLAQILRDERDAVPRGPQDYWIGYRDGLETAMRRLETDFGLRAATPASGEPAAPGEEKS